MRWREGYVCQSKTRRRNRAVAWRPRDARIINGLTDSDMAITMAEEFRLTAHDHEQTQGTNEPRRNYN